TSFSRDWSSDVCSSDLMGQRRWRFNPSSGWRRRSAPRAAAHAGRADLSDVAEQVLQEAALAAQRRRLVVLRIDPCDSVHAGAVEIGRASWREIAWSEGW